MANFTQKQILIICGVLITLIILTSVIVYQNKPDSTNTKSSNESSSAQKNSDLESTQENQIDKSLQSSESNLQSAKSDTNENLTIKKSIQVSDFITGNQVVGVTANVANYKEFVSDSQGNIAITIPENLSQSKIKFSKEGFKDIEINKFADLKDNIFMVSTTNKFVYTSEMDGTSRLYVSNFDASDSKVITPNEAFVSEAILKEDGFVYFKYDKDKVKGQYDQPIPQIYRARMDGTLLERISDIKGSFNNGGLTYTETADLNSLKKITIAETTQYDTNNFTSRLWVSDLKGNNKILVRDRTFTNSRESITQYKISRDGKQISYLVEKRNITPQTPYGQFIESKILIVEVGNSNKNQIIWADSDPKHILKLIGFSADNKNYVYTDVYDQVSTAYIQTVGTKDYSPVKNLIIRDGQFDNSDNLYFLRTIDNKSDLYKLSLMTGQAVKVTSTGKASNFMIDNLNQAILIESEKNIYLVRTDQLSKIEVSSNVKMWPDTGVLNN